MKRTSKIILLALFLTLGTEPGWAQSGHDLFQQALVKERSNGQMQEAVQLYERIVRDFPSDRPLVARALVRLGRAHELMGNQEAAEAYRRVLREYADQADMVAEARSRLAALQQREPEVAAGQVARQLVSLHSDATCGVWDMRPSPDDTRVAYSDLCSGGLYIRDLGSEDTVRVVDGWTFGAVWSGDGTRIAFRQLGPSQSVVKILDVETRVVSAPAALEGLGLSPLAWSSDGAYLAGVLTESDRTNSVVLVSLGTGERITLAERVNEGSGVAAFSPDARYVAFTDFADGNQDIHVMALGSRARQRVTTDPEADGFPLWSPDGTTIVYQNASGAWAIAMADGSVDGAPRLVRSEPLEWPLAWTPKGFYYASDNTVIRPYRISVDPESGRPRGSPEPIPMPVNDVGLLQLSWSPDMERIALAGWGDVIQVYSTEHQSLTAFPVASEILVANLWWSGDGTEILIASDARKMRDKRKTVFALNPADGGMRELFPRMESGHHIHLSPDGESIVFIRPSAKGQQIVLSEPGSPNGRVLVAGTGRQSPDGSIQGRWGQPLFSPDGTQILFHRLRMDEAFQEPVEETLWVVSTDGSEPRKVASARLIPKAVWYRSGRFIAYQELDASLEQGSLVVLSLETGAKHEVLSLSNEWGEVLLKTWSPDGRWIAITRETGGWEYWVIQDLLGENAAPGRQR
jgi:Tol biopolymer transport system component